MCLGERQYDMRYKLRYIRRYLARFTFGLGQAASTEVGLKTKRPDYLQYLET